MITSYIDDCLDVMLDDGLRDSRRIGCVALHYGVDLRDEGWGDEGVQLGDVANVDSEDV